jgi:isocitrate/isopropylmalate dehydrogenase
MNIRKTFAIFRNVLPRMALEMLRLRKERRLGTTVGRERVVGNWFGSRLMAYQAQHWE